MSVRNVDEARVACDFGANIVDVKEPNRGSLGRADWSTIADIVTTVTNCNSPIPVSVALGELAEIDVASTSSWRDRFNAVSFAKLGLAHATKGWEQKWKTVMQTLPANTERVAVAYADWKIAKSPPPSNIIEFAEQNECKIVLVDTFCKKNGGLFEILTADMVQNIVQEIRDRRMTSAMAGSLNIKAIETLLPLAPDIVAVRGAVCSGERTTTITPNKVQNLAQLISSTRTTMKVR